MRLRQDALWPENAEAWEIFSKIANKTAVELGLSAWLIESLTSRWSDDEKIDLAGRLDLIRQAITPVDHGGPNAQNSR